ncbi:MAG: multicopper oxidase domain-containing protein [Chitinophagales bacterium]|nr:multicopper oxidase domain-containing protein [Chitinophagales bacterium]
MKTSILTSALCWLIFQSAHSQTAIPIPDTLSGNSITLTMHQDSVQFFPGQFTQTLAFNQYAYLGPTLILNNSQNVNITVNNQIGDTTNVHWHGLHVSPSNDGGPHIMIMDGMSWNPQFTVLDKASTYWYHPHFHGKTAEHAIKGAAGIIIVRDNNEALLNLPRTYGVDDFPIVVQSAQLDSNNQFMPFGMQDSTVFVNGVRANYGYSAYLNVPAQVVRLRLLNAAGERTFNFGFTGNMPFKIIGSDGGLLNAPVNATRIRVSPGERYEILLDLSSMNGQNINLMSYGSELPMGVQGGPTMPMPPGNPPMDSPLNGVDYNILQLNVGSPTSNPVTSIPSTLVTVTPIPAAQSNITRPIEMMAINMMAMDGPFFFNQQLFDMERIDYYIPIDNTEIWELTNNTMVAHPFHIHDVQFYVLDRDGNLPPVHERGRKDVVLVMPQETVRFITKFETFTDTVVPYPFHCHILMHEDDGMMGQFLVVPSGFTGIDDNFVLTQSITVFPNPTSSFLQFELPENELVSYRITDMSGKVVQKQDNFSGNTIHVSQLSQGIYHVWFRSGSKYYSSKFQKQ